ncbi:unnamed protein product [Mytilus coruscus]|uniref:Reverse transcriptase domain-containing protein n=1 Tax=Mytilus coruscus TaxID=42192 RepID=A0A6J8A508_MYTCO|nr:unnamed protein product [Mytilus coruscus]
MNPSADSQIIYPETAIAHVSLVQSGKGLVGRSLAKSGGEVLVRLKNPSADSQIIYPGTAIDQVSTVQEVKMNEQNKYDKTYLRSDLQNLIRRSQQHLNSTEYVVVENLLKENETLFSASDSDLAPRRLQNTLAKEEDEQVDGMLKNGLITPSMSSWSAPVMLVRKKDGTMRFCVDYRKLNAVTVNDAFPLPWIDDSFDHLSGFTWYSTLDLSSEYWQVDFEPKDQPKTAFATIWTTQV